jgi:hypothetical protein
MRPRYALLMSTDLEASRSRPPVLKRAFAGLILIAAAALAIHVVFSLIMTVFWVVVAVAVVVAIVWALNQLL